MAGFGVNTIQRKILCATAGLLIVMLLFPPFTYKYEGNTINTGYSFILAPPRIRASRRSEVRVSLLGLQFLIVTTVGGTLCLAFKSERESSDDDPTASR